MDAAFKHFQIDSNYTSAENECDIGIDMSEVQTMSTANNENNENNGLTLTMNAANNEHYEQTPHERLSPVLPLVQEPPTAAPGMNDYNQTLTLYHFVDALKTLGYLLASIPRGLCHSLVIFVFSLIVQMYPTAPQSGCYISLLLALFHAKPVSWRDKGKLRLVSLVAIVFITIIFDIDWLISNYFVESLGGDDFEYKLTQQTSFVWQMAWWAVAINLFVYLMAIADYLNVWSLLRGYFVSKQKDIPKSVSQKVILVTWVELLSSLLILIYFFLIQSGAISGRMNIFNEATVQILSVQSTLLFKGTSGVIVFLSLVHHIKIRDLCGQCGCSYFCVVDSRETRRNQKKIVSSLKRSLNCIAVAKGVDVVLGVLLWISLVNAQSSVHYDAPKDVKVLLILMIVTNTFTSLTPLLVGSIIWSIRLSEKNRAETRLEAMDQNTPHRASRRVSRRDRHIRSADRRSIESPDASAYDSYSYDFGSPNVRSSQSLFTTRLDAASPSPTAPPLHHNGERTPQHAPFNLDLNLYCTPQEFESEWQRLSSCSCKEEYPISNIPTLAQCNLHFNQVGWSIIASGVVDDNITKLFLIAQRKMQMPVPARRPSPSARSGILQSSLRKTKSASPRCLAQLSFGMNSVMASLEMRSRHEDQIDLFIGSLELDDLFVSHKLGR